MQLLSTLPAEAPAPILIIGIGNPSRGDDAIGPLAVERLEALDLPGVELLTDFQLQVEHALDLVGRRAVIFIDATVAGEAAYTFEPLTPVAEQGATTHGFSPAAVLDVYRQYTDTPLPEAHVLAVRGFDFELGAPLSIAAARNLDTAVAMLVDRLRQGTD